MIKDAQIIFTRTTPPGESILTEEAHKEAASITAISQRNTVDILSHHKDEIFKFTLCSIES